MKHRRLPKKLASSKRRRVLRAQLLQHQNGDCAECGKKMITPLSGDPRPNIICIRYLGTKSKGQALRREDLLGVCRECVEPGYTEANRGRIVDWIVGFGGVQPVGELTGFFVWDDELQADYVAALRRDPCAYCGEVTPLGRGTIDHIIPRSSGGEDHPSNYAAACETCNQVKLSSRMIWFVALVGASGSLRPCELATVRACDRARAKLSL